MLKVDWSFVCRCHLFLDSENSLTILNELRRFIHANSVDRHIIRKFVGSVFGKASPTDGPQTNSNAVASDLQIKTYREVALSIETLVNQLDMPVRPLRDYFTFTRKSLIVTLKISPRSH